MTSLAIVLLISPFVLLSAYVAYVFFLQYKARNDKQKPKSGDINEKEQKAQATAGNVASTSQSSLPNCSLEPVSTSLCDPRIENLTSEANEIVPFDEVGHYPVDYGNNILVHTIPNPELATSGTGVGVPAFEGTNETPAPFKPSPKVENKPKENDTFDVAASDKYFDTSVTIDYPISSPLVPTPCDKVLQGAK